jgi:ribose 5-phosphate isomerase B
MEKFSATIMNASHLPSNGTLAFSSDHGGYDLKEFLKKAASDWGYTTIDCGTHSPDSVDYPDYIEPVVKEVLKGALGVMICGSGIGMSIGANRFKGIRAALCMNNHMAQLARTHNNANVLVLGERLMGKEESLSCLDTFLNNTFEEGRHTRRVEKLDEFGC